MSDLRFHHPLPAWAHKRPVTVFMLFVSIVVVGIISTYQIPLEFAPETTNPWLWCWVSYPNSTPEETDHLIGEVLEDELKQVRWLTRMEIQSSTQGCSANLQFETNTDMDVATVDVRDACERAKRKFPRNTDRISLHHNKSSDWPIMWCGLSVNNDSESTHVLLENRIKPTLERVPGVALVETHGFESEKLFIDLDLNRVRAHNIDISRVYGDLLTTNRNPSIGTLQDSSGRYILRTRYRLDSIEEYRNLPVQNGSLKLEDIADIDSRIPDQRRVFRINAREGATISIQKNALANTVEVAERINETLEDLMKDPDLQGLTFIHFFNQAEWIVESLRSLRSAGLWGALFACVVLFFFIRHFNAMLIIVMAVPVSILAAMICLYFLNFSLNVATMMGLMLAIGMLVDNSIVVSENIFRLRGNGMTPEEASIQGAGRVGTAITASTLTTIIVFLPMVFGRGEIGIWMKQIGMPITFSLLASLLIALSIVPLAMTRIVRRDHSLSSRIIPWLTGRYLKILEWVLNHRIHAFLIVTVLLVSVSYPYSRVEKSMEEGGGERQLFIRILMPRNYILEESEKIMTDLESIILDHREELDVMNVGTRIGENDGHLRLFLRSDGKGLLTDSEIKERVRELFPQIPGVRWWFGWQGDQGSSGREVDITLQGNSSSVLAQLAEDVRPYIEAIPGVVEVRTREANPMDEIHLVIQRETARRVGISPVQIARTVATGLMGQQLPRFKQNDQEIDVILQLGESDRKSFQDLKNLIIYNDNAQGYALRTLADFSVEPGRGEVTRLDGKIHHVIQIEFDTDDVADIRSRIERGLNAFKLPSGYTWSYGRSFRQFDLGMKEFNQAFMLALILVILLLGALFESLLHPFTIIFSLPFAMIGVYWTLFFTGTTQDIRSSIGLVLLIGIVVNNAIVLVDHINQLRTGGLQMNEAIRQGGQDRFRPIVMTAATTVLGLAPMAFSGASASGHFYSGLAITVMGGLLVSTLLTLLIIPLIYTFMDDLQESLKRLVVSLVPGLQKHQTASVDLIED
ncbi:efflux RND transporter permease subunit [bacterium]|nr:efflux RND transporter permease subunit [candidate division CSSED10-310 bacterium]